MGSFTMLVLFHTVTTINGYKYQKFIKIFWVGLMDGDGSIQVNHWHKKSLEYRLIIKLSYLISNYNMLIQISKVIGGRVRIVEKNKSVIWVVDKKETIIKIINIFDIYPPLTSRKLCQLRFLKECMLRDSVDWYFRNRNNKYNSQQSIINIGLGEELPHYFKEWLSGFVEAEGCFCTRKVHHPSFSIGQKNDVYLINAIKKYFGGTNSVRILPRDFYFWEVYKKEVLIKIINHFHNYPLLGNKTKSFEKWKLL